MKNRKKKVDPAVAQEYHREMKSKTETAPAEFPEAAEAPEKPAAVPAGENAFLAFFRQENTRYILKLAGILFTITFTVALLLSLVNVLTKDQIAENTQKSLEEAMAVVFPEAQSFDTLDLELSGSVTQVMEAKKGSDTLGYVFRMAPSGFGGKMDMIVGADLDGEVAGVSVITHSETPNLGARVVENSFSDQFAGKTEGVEVIKNRAPEGNEIEAISGATISSRAVTDAVNEALAMLETIKGGGSK